MKTLQEIAKRIEDEGNRGCMCAECAELRVGKIASALREAQQAALREAAGAAEHRTGWDVYDADTARWLRNRADTLGAAGDQAR